MKIKENKQQQQKHNKLSVNYKTSSGFDTVDGMEFSPAGSG